MELREALQVASWKMASDELFPIQEILEQWHRAYIRDKFEIPQKQFELDLQEMVISLRTLREAQQALYLPEG